jgi:integrase
MRTDRPVSAIRRDVGRRRFQPLGYLYQQNGYWRFRWREDALDAQGTIRRIRPGAVIGPSKGAAALTERQARREASLRYLSKVNQLDAMPGSLMKVRTFIENIFVPDHVNSLKIGGQVHYNSVLKHVTAGIGDESLRNVGPREVTKLLSGILSKTHTIGKNNPREQRYSVQTALHVRNAVSAIFEHAIGLGIHQGTNPARRFARLPEMVRKKRHALTVSEMKQLVAALPTPARELAMMAVLTGTRISELCGLQWRVINTTSEPVIVDGDVIPPMALAVWRAWSCRKGGGAYASLKSASSRRILPIDPQIERVLAEIAKRGVFLGPDDPVFASKAGTPIDAHNLSNRNLRPAGAALGFEGLGWHTLRHTFITWCRMSGASPADQMAALGHSGIQQTMRYGEQDLDRRRGLLAAIELTAEVARA